MDFRAAYEQQQEARWRVFLMFIVMALLIIRSGLVSRERRGQLIFFRPAPVLTRHSLHTEKSKLSPYTCPSPSPDELYCATLVVLAIAEIAGDLYVLNTREVWQLMNQPPFQLLQEQPCSVTCLCERQAQRLDTS